MAGLIAAFDWSQTPLGAIDTWPDALTVPVGTILRAQVPMTIVWGEHAVLLYNDEYAAFSGARHPRLLGQDIREACPEIADFNEAVNRTVLGGKTLTYQDQQFWLDRNGAVESLWVNLHFSPLVDAAGRPVGVLALVLDVSAGVLARRNLTNERERFATLFDQSPSFMAMLEGPEHRITLANPNYLRLVGHRPVLGRTVAEALPDALEQG